MAYSRDLDKKDLEILFNTRDYNKSVKSYFDQNTCEINNPFLLHAKFYSKVGFKTSGLKNYNVANCLSCASKDYRLQLRSKHSWKLFKKCNQCGKLLTKRLIEDKIHESKPGNVTAKLPNLRKKPKAKKAKPTPEINNKPLEMKTLKKVELLKEVLGIKPKDHKSPKSSLFSFLSSI